MKENYLEEVLIRNINKRGKITEKIKTVKRQKILFQKMFWLRLKN